MELESDPTVLPPLPLPIPIQGNPRMTRFESMKGPLPMKAMNMKVMTMKKALQLSAILLAGTSVPALSHAHADKLEMIKIHVPVVLEKFRAEEPTRLPLFIGVKAWPVDHSVQAKVYLSDGTAIQYSCVELGAEGPEQKIVCNKM